jgi:subtilisin family serine protease
MLLALSAAAPVAAAPPPVGAGQEAGSWIALLAPGQSAPRVAPGLARVSGGEVGLTFTHAVTGFQFHGSAAAAAALRRNPKVVSVTPDHAITLSAETLPTGIERIAAFDNDAPQTDAYHNGFRGAGARIAIVDTGIDLDHPDLVGSIDQGDSKNCVNPAAPPNDGHGHGTHVAGTAAASLNGVGVVGVAPEAELVAVKIFDDAGNSSESLVLCGFDHVMALNADADSTNDIDVMNMSFGEQRAWGDCATDALHAAVCAAHAAGVIMVAGSGNSAVDAGTSVPAAFPEVISVSALTDFDTQRGGLAGCKFILELFSTECDDTLAVFSNFGGSVDVVAPGVFIYSTWPDGTYKTSSGTSMATPHVAGVAAIMAAAAPGLAPADAMAHLRAAGECPDGTIAGADGSCAGQGTWPDDPDGIAEPMLHALRSVVAAGGNPPEPTAPGPPTLTAASAGDASVALTWTAPANTGGSPITGYQIWRGTSSGTASLLTSVGVQTGYTDTGVANGTTYYYQVAAVNAVGTGPGSNERSATPSSLVPVSRLGGAVSNFGSVAATSGSMSFSLPAGTDRLVAMISVSGTFSTVSSMTWKPDPANPALNQALTRVGRQVASGNGAVEIWELADPTPGVAGAALSHTLNGSAKRVLGVHALAGVGGHGTPVGAGVNGSTISVDVLSQPGALVLDVLFAYNSTTVHSPGAGQSERWDLNTTGGTNNLRGTGSSEAGAASTTMSWTSGAATHHALLAVSFNPR